jgi:hypothetical protein
MGFLAGLWVGVGTMSPQMPPDALSLLRSKQSGWSATALGPALARYLDEVRPLLIAAKPPGGVDPTVRPRGARLWLGQGVLPTDLFLQLT